VIYEAFSPHEVSLVVSLRETPFWGRIEQHPLDALVKSKEK
jgi:hypothetical protein